MKEITFEIREDIDDRYFAWTSGFVIPKRG
jgi:hypothetical protein